MLRHQIKGVQQQSMQRTKTISCINEVRSFCDFTVLLVSAFKHVYIEQDTVLKLWFFSLVLMEILLLLHLQIYTVHIRTCSVYVCICHVRCQQSRH